MGDKQHHKDVEKLIRDGDKHADKGKFDKALKKYREAYALDPAHEGIHQRLLDTQEKALGAEEWDMQDFAEHMDWIMKKQERDYPPIKQTHAKLEPAWKQVSELMFKILSETDDEKAAQLTEELVAHGEIATRALIDFIRRMAQESRGEGSADNATTEMT